MNELNTPGLNRLSIQALAGAAKWAKFIAILGFVLAGLMFVFAFFLGTIFSSSMANAGAVPIAEASGAMMTVVYIIAAGISAIIYFFLYKFAKGTQNALASGDENALADGLGGLKTYFKIQGVLMIVGLACIALSVVGGMIIALAAAL